MLPEETNAQLERERDEARAQLDQAIEQSGQQFGEISALLRQRDAAVQSAERTAERLHEVEAKLDQLSRERNDAQRQRDDALRQRDEAKRGGRPSSQTTSEGPSQLTEIQRQIVSIRQARDSSQAQNHELANQLARLENEMAELGDARDAALKEVQAAREEAGEFRAQLAVLSQERDAAAQQAHELQGALDILRSAPLGEVGDEVAVSQRELLNALEERDALQEQVRELRAELESQSAEAGEPGEIDQLRGQLAEANAEREMQAIREEELLAHLSGQEEQLSVLQKSRDDALVSLSAAQKEKDAQMAALRAQAEPRSSGNETRLEVLQRELDDALPKLAQFDTQRLQMIDLAAQLDAARRDVLKLSADVAEARLQAKFAQTAKNGPRPAPAPRRSKPTESEPFTMGVPTSPALAAPLQSSGEDSQGSDERWPAPSAETSAAEIAGRNALATMKHCFQTFTKSPGDMGLLRELHTQIEAFSETARVSGFVALHRLSGAFASFVLELHKYPELLNQSSFRTVNATIDFLGVLLKQKDYTALKDPATAVVYVVDDEADNCQAISMGMETVMLRTQCAQDPSVALAELAQARFDLIILDVSMPQMSGFELCQQLRQTPMHARTPIVFLTGMTTIENRVQSSLSGGNDMIAKPFVLAELSLKALTLILRSSLNME